MTDKSPKGVFNISSQHGNISNVAGDLTMHGNQEYVAASGDMVREELTKLQRALSTTGIDPGVKRSVMEHLTNSHRELDKSNPDPHKVAGSIEQLTRLLKDAGALSVAGTALIDPLQRVASWLGTSGQAILQLMR
jgi:NADP-dependent 3-hydroxy acid dehydrogenase YdfG